MQRCFGTTTSANRYYYWPTAALAWASRRVIVAAYPALVPFGCSSLACGRFVQTSKEHHGGFWDTRSRRETWSCSLREAKHLHMVSTSANEVTEKEEQMRRDAMLMVKSGIQSVHPNEAVAAHISIQTEENSSFSSSSYLQVLDSSNGSWMRYYSLEYDRVVVLAFGKASVPMALTTCQIVQEMKLEISGVVIAKDDHATQDEIATLQKQYNVTVFMAGHPLPDQRGIDATNELLNHTRHHANPRTLVLCCISGGGSALFCAPRPPLTVQDWTDVNDSLLRSGMDISKMNVIRRALDQAKGGGLAVTSYPSTVVSLVLSDVVGDPLDLIASGPTVPPPRIFSTQVEGEGKEEGKKETNRDTPYWRMVQDLVHTHGLDTEGPHPFPPSVLQLVHQGAQGSLTKNTTPLADSAHPVFTSMRPSSIPYEKERPTLPLCQTILVGTNRRAVEATAKKAHRLGYNAVILGTRVEGEAQAVAGVYAALAEQLCQQQDPTREKQEQEKPSFAIAPLPAALIAGGETTVTFSSSTPPGGKGGRNQELGLTAAMHFKRMGLRNVVLASVGTDGTDGPTDAAGAVVDGGTVDRLEVRTDMTADEALRRHDSYTFFDSEEEDEDDVPSLIRTGPTGTNVADIAVILVR